MDRRRKVTVVDLERDGYAAVEDRRKKAEAAAAKKLDEMHCRGNVEEPETSLPEKDKPITMKENKLSVGQAGRREEESTSPVSPAAPLATEEHQLDVAAKHQSLERSSSQGKQDESLGVVVTLQKKGTPPNGSDQQGGRAHILSFEDEGKLDDPHPPKGTTAKNELASLKDRGVCEVSDTKASKNSAPQRKKERIIRREYTASPPAATEVTGNILFDQLNRFMDEWLVPDEVSSHVKVTGTTATPGDALGHVSRDAQSACTPSSHDLQHGTTGNTGGDWKSCLPTCCGSSNTRGTTVCPVCNQNMGGIDDFKAPSLSLKWTRWIFRQCEEPLDIEAEFLVTPRARLVSPWVGTRGLQLSACQQPLPTPMLGVTQ